MKKFLTILILFMLLSGVCLAQNIYWDNPAMTSDTTPSPNAVSASSEYSAAYLAWMAGDRNIGSAWAGANATVPAYWRYDAGVGNSNLCRELLFAPYAGEGFNAFTFQGSQDGSTWSNLVSGNGGNTTVWNKYAFTNNTFYRFYQIYISSVYADFPMVYTILLSAGNSVHTFMTSDTAPAPCKVYADSTNSTYAGWQAFDNNPGTFWTAGSGYPNWLTYDFGSNVVVNGLTISGYSGGYGPSNFIFAGSADNSTWITLQTNTMANNTLAQPFTNGNAVAYRYYKVTFSNGYSSGCAIYDILFKSYSGVSSPATTPRTPWSFCFNKPSGGGATGWTDPYTYLSRWRIHDITNTNFLDDSGNSRNLINVAGTTTNDVSINATFWTNRCATFAGSQYLWRDGQIINGTQSYTMFCWFWTAVVPGTIARLVETMDVDGNNQASLTLYLDNKIYSHWVTGGATNFTSAATPFTTGTWHFAALRWDSTTGNGTLYYDGTVFTNAAVPSISSFSHVSLGAEFRYTPPSSYFYTGKLAYMGMMQSNMTDAALSTIQSNTCPTNSTIQGP